MNAFNPLESMKRLEQAGIPREHAEAIAAEIDASKKALGTEAYSCEQLAAALDRLTIRLSVIMVAAASLACIVLGVVLTN